MKNWYSRDQIGDVKGKCTKCSPEARDKEMIVMRKKTVVRKDREQGSNLTITCKLKENAKTIGIDTINKGKLNYNV